MERLKVRVLFASLFNSNKKPFPFTRQYG